MRTIKSLTGRSNSRVIGTGFRQICRRFTLALLLGCLAIGVTTVDASGAQKKVETKGPALVGKAPSPARQFVELTAANFGKEMVSTGTIPYLLETCVPQACQLEEPELNLLAKSLAGKVKVLRLNMAEQPKLFGEFLAALTLETGNPFLPLILHETPARWAMHTVLTPQREPVGSLFGLMTGEMLAGFVAAKLEKPTEVARALMSVGRI